MMYKAVIFDLDGTILDTLDDLTNAANAALTKCGLPLRTREEVRSFIGNGIKNLMERASGGNGDQALILSAFKTHYAAHYADETKPYEGIQALLSALKQKGLKIGVLSNKADAYVQPLVQGYFPDTFDGVQGADEERGIRRKPCPDALYAMLEKWNVSKAETAYVGDSEVDIQTAKNAGVDCISVAWGFKDEAFLKENGAKTLARSAEEVLRIVTR